MCSELVSLRYVGIPDDRQLVRSEVARQLDAVLSGPDAEGAIFQALSASASTARYWQEPDADDVLLADQDVSGLFWPIAEAVVRHPSALWWSGGADVASQVYAMPDWTSYAFRLFDKPVADALRGLRADTIDENQRMRAHRRDGGEELWSMTSGTWWTPPIGAAPSTTREHPKFGPIELSVQEDAPDYSEARSWRVSLRDDTQVYEVDSGTAWADLVRRYPIEVTYGRGANWRQATGRDSAWAIPDWQAVSADYDAVHLTVAGYLNASGRVVNIDANTASFIAGWNADETYWLTDIGIADDQATRWSRDSQEQWRPIA